jgi:hypothetical protein
VRASDGDSDQWHGHLQHSAVCVSLKLAMSNDNYDNDAK